MQRFSEDDTNRKLILRERKKSSTTYPKRGKEIFRTFESCYFVYVPLICLMQKFMGNKMVGKGRLEDAIYLDSQRAFDEGLHKRLLRKLANHWARGKGLSIMG